MRHLRHSSLCLVHSALCIATFLLAQGVFALVYLDPANGDDANDGASESAPVKTFGRARELAQGGDVSLMGTISVAADTDFDLDGGTLRRYISADGTVTNGADIVSCAASGVTLTFSHIVVEGLGTTVKANGRLVTATKANVVLAAGATLRNSFAASAPAGVTCATLTMTGDSRIEHCRLENGGTLVLADSASIVSNSTIPTSQNNPGGQAIMGGTAAAWLGLKD